MKLPSSGPLGAPEQFDVQDTWTDACKRMWEWVKYLQAHYPVYFAILRMPPKLRNGDPGDYFVWLLSFAAVVTDQTRLNICSLGLITHMATHMMKRLADALEDALPKERENDS